MARHAHRLAGRLLAGAIALACIGAEAASAQSPQPVAQLLGPDGKFVDPPLAGSPVDDLPYNGRVLASFGERPVFSPDGTRIAFIGRSYGDAFEYDMRTGRTRNLTSHTPHAGFLRVHYLADGNFLLLGPRRMGASTMATRLTAIELWYLDAAATGPVKPLGQVVWEGLAVARDANRIAWSIRRPESSHTEPLDGYTALMTGEIVVENGHPRLADVREHARRRWSQCYIEPQDFYDGGRRVTASCYRYQQLLTPANVADYLTIESRVWSIELATGAMTPIPTPPALYAEPEGILPNGRETLVECGNDDRTGLDICRLELTTDNPRYTRLTYATRYGRFRFSNPVVSPDGRTIAFQAGRAATEPGVGDGILIMDMPPQ